MLVDLHKKGSSVTDRNRRIIVFAIVTAGLMLLGWLLIVPRKPPDLVRAIDRPARPKIMHLERKKRIRSEKAIKFDRRTEKSIEELEAQKYGCEKKIFLNKDQTVFRLERDNDCDGIADSCRVDELNAYGEVVRTEIYEECDGSPKYCSESIYNEYGEEVEMIIDNDCDDSIDGCITTKRNEYGDIVEEFSDDKCDNIMGKDDWRHCWELDYDDNGLIIDSQMSDCVDKPMYCTKYEYNFKTGVRRDRWDTDCDGSVDYCFESIFREGFTNADKFRFPNEDCTGPWESCNIYGQAQYSMKTFYHPDFCAKKYEEFVRLNSERE